MKNEEETFEFWPRFDAYTKTVARRANSRYLQKQKTESKYIEIIDHDVLLCVMVNRETQDQYPSDRILVCAGGRVMELSDEQLGESMRQLPERMQWVLILKFARRCKEKQIASEMQVSVRSCYTLRKKAIDELRKMLEADNDET